MIGLPRTGTSVVTKSLQLSGYNLGEDVHLLGHKYKTELTFTRTTSQAILIKREGKVSPKFFTLDDLNQSERDMITSAKALIEEKKVQVIKDAYMLMLSFAWGFGPEKFIRTRRNFQAAVKSMLRLQERLGLPIRTYEHQARILQFFKGMEDDFFTRINDVPTHTVWLEDLLENTEQEGDKLSEFLGRKFDTSLISPDETYEAIGIAQ